MAMANTNIMITIILSLFLFFFTQIPTLSASNQTDFLSLIDFKIRIQSDPSRLLNSWNHSIHFCDWHGITCGRKHKRVTVLDVSSLHLVGTLSPSIGNLTFLRKIHLEGNSFHGVVPQAIGSLYRLQNLDLASNSFEGLIPANLSSCKNLRFIQFYGNKLSGRISDQLGALPNLLRLGLAENNFIGSIPACVGNISTLQTLDLGENNLTGNIPHELGKLFNLQQLYLGINKLSDSFPLAIYNISSIRVLSISNNHLTGQIPDSFGLILPKLKIFVIAANYFSGSIPSTLANASYLEIIDISQNNITGPIPQNLGRLQHLQDLQLAENPLLVLATYKNNDISFITTLTNCTNLVSLDLSGIEIGGVLPLEISNLSKTLTYFRIHNNHISGYLPEGIGELVGLNVFDAGRNVLLGNIPLSIGKLINMKELFLHDNKFEGEIPPSIGDMSGMLILSLFGNMLTGSIPLSLMSNLTQLEVLDLSYNHLYGIVPPEIFSLTSRLLELDLDDNKFTGPLPLEIGNLKQLVWLSISENELSGEIPITIGGCVMLENLYLYGNLLNGTIPSSLGELKSIEFMDFSRNHLSGEIPTSLKNLKFIAFLDLSFNMLEGEVPKNGVFANASAFSIAGNGRLCGGIKSLSLHECLTKDSEKYGKLRFSMDMVLPAILVVAFMSMAYSCVFYHRLRASTSRSIREPMNSPMGEQYPKLSYAQLLQATDRFSPDNLIGTGRYSWVYKGVLTQFEQCIAVKVIKLDQRGAKRSFVAECEALKHIRHRNLVKIITACSGTDFQRNEFKALVYEFMSNGNLDSWLHPTSFESTCLDLLQRLSISIDVASVLVYLHHGCEIPILHRDIKPSNILLDNDFCAHLGDFGSARSLLNPIDRTSGGRIHPTANEIVGTVGYIALEYAVGGPASTLVDVYSYGILLLEMFTGKRPTDTMFKDAFSLHNYVKMAIPDKVMSIADPRLFAECENNPFRTSGEAIRKNKSELEKCLASVFRVGVICSAHLPKERMEIADALVILETVRDTLSKLLY